MQHKKIIAALMFLGLLTLTACGGKKIDDNDLVSIDYKYTFSDGTVIEEGTKDITIGASNSTARIDSIIMGAKKDREFNGKMNGKEIYKSEYNPNNVQPFAGIILTEVMNVSNPQIGTKIETNSMGAGVITSVEKDSDGYDSYIVDFNDPKTYSDLLYYIKVTNIEKL